MIQWWVPGLESTHGFTLKIHRTASFAVVGNFFGGDFGGDISVFTLSANFTSILMKPMFLVVGT